MKTVLHVGPGHKRKDPYKFVIASAARQSMTPDFLDRHVTALQTEITDVPVSSLRLPRRLRSSQ